MNRSRDSDSPRYLVCLLTHIHRRASASQSWSQKSTKTRTRPENVPNVALFDTFSGRVHDLMFWQCGEARNRSEQSPELRAAPPSLWWSCAVHYHRQSSYYRFRGHWWRLVTAGSPQTQTDFFVPRSDNQLLSAHQVADSSELSVSCCLVTSTELNWNLGTNTIPFFLDIYVKYFTFWNRPKILHFCKK